MMKQHKIFYIKLKKFFCVEVQVEDVFYHMLMIFVQDISIKLLPYAHLAINSHICITGNIL